VDVFVETVGALLEVGDCVVEALAYGLAVGIDCLVCAGFQCGCVGFIMARSMRSRLNVDVSVQRSSLASSLLAIWSVRVRIRKPADLIVRGGSVELDAAFVDDLELDRNPRNEHRSPDPVTVNRRCSA